VKKTDYLLKNLNPAQREAVVAPPGPLLIIAGAGSGKTRVLTHRIAYFIASGINPENILAITFTNKAADEMRNRVSHLLNQRPTTNNEQQIAKSRMSSVVRHESSASKALPFMGTFHSLALRILRKDSHALGIPKTFTIADESDTLSIMKRILKQQNIPPDRITPSDALSRISQEKSELRGPEKMQEHAQEDTLIYALYDAYQRVLSREHLLDFDDLLFFAVKLLQTNTPLLQKYQKEFSHLFVDEYQDTNTAQYQLVGVLAKKHKSITVVGDDYQAIYGWRHADYRNILNFHNDYPQTRIVKLEKNYRSTQTILDAADSIIKKVNARTEKTLVATRPGGSPVFVTELSDERAEAAWVIETIYALQKKHISLSDMVVLYRTNAQSRPFEEILVRKHIPYRIIGGLRFYERKEIKDVLAFLRYLKNEHDQTSLNRIINIPPRGIGKVGLERIHAYGIEAAAQTSEAVRDFRALIRFLREKQQTLPLAKFIKELLRATQYKAYLRDAYSAKRTYRGDQHEERWENIEELIGVASRYDILAPADALERFLEDAALFSHADAVDARANALNLMTMHLAKGLEFSVVFIVGCEEGLLPHARSMQSSDALDEERRLCYVALTRAKDIAHFTYVEERTLHGERTRRIPSRFLSELPEHATEYQGGRPDEFELIEEWEDF